MKNLIIISILTILTSCSPSFDFYEAEKLIENMKEDNRIYSLTFQENTIIINGQKTSINKEEVAKFNETGFNYEYRADYLNSIDVSKKEFDSFLLQFKKTKAYSVDYLDNKAYFIMDSFLDGSKGYLYSIKDLRITSENSKNEIKLNDGNITIISKKGINWYEATGWH